MARKHYTIPPSSDQSAKLSKLRQVAESCGCEAKIYDATDRPIGTKTLVMKGDAEKLLDAMVLEYLGLNP